MSKLSKKQAKEIANLINACTSWSISVNMELAKPVPEYDNKRCRRLMGYHNEAADKLNAILGQIAVFKFEV